jgi:hypothetical protein
VLVTDRPASLLPTVRSRCQTVSFGLLDAEQTQQVLRREDVSDEDAQAAATIAGGSPGRALAFLRDGVVPRARELWARLDDAAPVASFLKESAEAQGEAALQLDPLGSKDAGTRGGYRLYLTLAADHLRRRLADADEWQMPMWCDLIDAVDRCDRYLAANVNADLALRQLELSIEAEAA